jgi:hypothetical protein
VIRHKRQEARDKTKNCLSAFYTNESVCLILLRHLKDESYNQFSEALREKMIILADKLKPKIYEYGFLRK